jgi:hypothetical protein
MSWRNAFVEHLGPGGFSGATLGEWLRVLRDNRAAIDAPFWPRAALITWNGAWNSLVKCRLFPELLPAPAVANARARRQRLAPVF